MSDVDMSEGVNVSSSAGPVASAAEGSVAGGLYRAWLALGLAGLVAGSGIVLYVTANVPTENVIAAEKRRAKSARRKGQKKRKKSQRTSVGTEVAVRTPRELKLLQETYHGVAFDEEPLNSRWAAKAVRLLRHATRVAQREAFADAPEPAQLSIKDLQCKTIRCRFVLQSTREHEIEAMVSALKRLKAGDDEDLWAGFFVRRQLAEGEQLQERVTVILTRDDFKTASVRMADASESVSADR